MGQPVLPEVTVGAEEGYVDLSFRLESLRRDPAGQVRLVARGMHGGTPVGFGVSLSSKWKMQALEDPQIPLYLGRADLTSLGAESDAFLHALDELYQTNINPEKMQEQVSYIALSLEGDPAKVEHTPVMLKLFFESEKEERDADFFLNIDPVRSSVEFREKDIDFRRGIVLSLLSSNPGQPSAFLANANRAKVPDPCP